MIGGMAMALLGRVGWKNIALSIIILGVVLSVGFYIKTAETNREKVKTLDRVNKELLVANEENIRFFEKNILAVQDALIKERERDSDYAENIKVIQSRPNGTCVRASPVLIQSLRMRNERRAGR